MYVLVANFEEIIRTWGVCIKKHQISSSFLIEKERLTSNKTILVTAS